MKQKPQFKLNIKEVESIYDGHGIVLWYIEEEFLHGDDKKKFTFAYIPGFAWMRDSSQIVEIQILKPDNEEFLTRGINRDLLITEMREAIVPFLQSKHASPRKISDHIYAHRNC